MLKRNNYIDEKLLLEKVDESSIFERYFGPFEIKSAVYKSPFRSDSNPSTGFYINARGRITFNDFGTQEKLDCIQFVMKLYGVDYKQALHRIAVDFQLIDTKGDVLEGTPKITHTSINKKKKEKKFQVSYKDFNPEHIAYWEQYGITVEELENNFVYPVNTLYVDGVPYASNPECPRFCYLIKGKDKEYIKIYSPLDERKFKWLATVPIFLPFGIYDLPFKSDTLIIAKSQKDRIVLKKFRSDVIALQNESSEALLERTAKYLKHRYKRIIVWFDNDGPGIRALEHYRDLGFEVHHFPDFWLQKGVKDPADFAKVWGLKDLGNYLKQNLL
jgi:hypothetical protein